MVPYYQDRQLVLYQGDCRTVLAEMEPDSVDCVVTSPPYLGLRKYSGEQDGVWGSVNGCEHEWEPRIKPASSGGKHGARLEGGTTNQYASATHEAQQSATCRLCGAWRGALGLEPTVEMYVEHIVEVFRAVKPVLKRTGSLWLNIGDSYAGSGQGWQKGNSSIPRPWLNEYGTDSPPGYISGRQPNGLKPKDLMLVPFRLALALQADGWWVRSDIVWAKANPMPESVTDRPTKSHEYIFLLTKRAEYYFDQEAVREPNLPQTLERYQHVDSLGLPKVWTENGGNGIPISGGKTVNFQLAPNGRNIRTVWTIPTEPTPMAHFATYPQELVKRCILAGTSERGICAKCGKPWERVVEKKPNNTGYPNGPGGHKRYQNMLNGGIGSSTLSAVARYDVQTIVWRPNCRCEAPTVPATVLDPFGGSGTTGLVARKLGRRAILVELSHEYADMSLKRITALPVPLLMADVS